ncbi:glycosyltransferase family 39 protein [Gorillibacterium sp. CAU 1737]|uniref:glycosyltransferase family 39 protein n=1 Tax=Gorillibacterium sp. CAU 1737 TaxID=3140362 RepID=UPI0032608683
MKKLYGILLVLLVAAALVLRVGYVATSESTKLSHDEKNYSDQAVRLVTTGVYAYNAEEPNARVTPGYPLFVASFVKLYGADRLPAAQDAVRYLQCVLGAASVLLLFAIGRELWSPRAGLIAAAIAAFYPTYIWSPQLLTTETLFLAAFLGMLLAQAKILTRNRLRDHIAAGFLVALTVLIRPQVLPLAVVPYLFLWVRDRRLYMREILVAVGAFVLLMLPWWIRNLVTLNEFVLTAKGGMGNPFLAGTDPYFKGTIDWNEAQKGDQFQEGIKRLKEGLKEDPWLWIRWFTVGKFMVIFKTPRLTLPGVLADVFTAIHLAFAWVGWLALLSFRNRPLRFLAVGLLLLVGIQLLFIPVARYAYPMYAFLMLGAGYAVSLVWNRLRRPEEALGYPGEYR